jgi:hypothetical protein
VAGSEGLSPVRAPDADNHGKIADNEVSDAVDGRQCPHRIIGGDFFCDCPQLVDRCGMGRVFQAGDQPPPIMIANRSDEEGNPARSRIGDGSEHLIN